MDTLGVKPPAEVVAGKKLVTVDQAISAVMYALSLHGTGMGVGFFTFGDTVREKLGEL